MSRRISRNVLSLAGLATALVLCLVYLSLQVLQTPVTSRPDTIRVELERTGGLFEGSAVTYRGLRVGRVSRIRLTDDGAEAFLRITDSRPIPRDAVARVRSLSPIGEQFLDLRPRSEGPPYLTDGDRISGTAVDVPVSLASAADALDAVLDQVDADDVGILLTELAAATTGTQDELATLLDSTEELTAALDEAWPATERLLVNGRTTLRTLAGSSAELISLSRSAKLFAAFLAEFDPTLRDVLAQSPARLAVVQGLVRDLRSVLPPFLANLVEATDLLAARDPHVEELLGALPYGVERFASAFRDGYLQINLNLQGIEQCDYAGVVERDPRSTEREPLKRDGRCPVDSPVTKRGAQHAPGPVPYRD